MRYLLAWTMIGSLALATGLKAQEKNEPKSPARFEPEIFAFEMQDRKQLPEPGGIVFVGSSSIRLWNTDEAFPRRKIINRGFGGSELSDSVHFAERIILPYKPKTVVLYAGDNDIAGGKSAVQVQADFQAFVKLIHQHLPETRIVFIAVKPSPSRWKFFPEQQRANSLIRAIAESQPDLDFIDVVTPMLGQDGQPRPELFRDDKLHLSEAGYKLWNELLEKNLAGME